jgi:predicted small secreted protein
MKKSAIVVLSLLLLAVLLTVSGCDYITGPFHDY